MLHHIFIQHIHIYNIFNSYDPLVITDLISIPEHICKGLRLGMHHWATSWISRHISLHISYMSSSWQGIVCLAHCFTLSHVLMVHTINVVICALQFWPVIQDQRASGYHTRPCPLDAMSFSAIRHFIEWAKRLYWFK